MDTPERIAKLEAQVDAIKDDVSELKTDVKEIHSRITTGNREIMDKIESMSASLETKMRINAVQASEQHLEIEQNVKRDVEKLSAKINLLERWRWMIVGGAIVFGYIVGNFDLFTKIFR